MSRLLIAHIPAITKPYMELIESREFTKIALPDETITDVIRPLKKDIRALDPRQCADIIMKYSGIDTILVGRGDVEALVQTYDTVTMPRDDVTTSILGMNILNAAKIELATTFFRWHRDNISTASEIMFDRSITVKDLPDSTWSVLSAHRAQSTDWWRQVACVALGPNDEIILSANNHYVPSPDSAEISGDMRAQSVKGVGIELANAQHAEAALVAQAAKRGIALEGTRLVVTTFPCPVCAKLLAESGIKEVLFMEGYAVADGVDVLKAARIILTQVTGVLPHSDEATIPKNYPF